MLIVKNLPPFYVICYLLNSVTITLILKDMIDDYRHAHKLHHSW